MESIESTYGPLRMDEKAFLFFPNSTDAIIQKNSKRPSRAKKGVVSSTTGKSSTTIMREKRFINFMNTWPNTRFNMTEITLTSRGFFFSFSLMVTSPRKLFRPFTVISSLKKPICLLTFPSLKS